MLLLRPAPGQRRLGIPAWKARFGDRQMDLLDSRAGCLGDLLRSLIGDFFRIVVFGGLPRRRPRWNVTWESAHGLLAGILE